MILLDCRAVVSLKVLVRGGACLLSSDAVRHLLVVILIVVVCTAIVFIRVLVEGDRLCRLHYYLHLLQWFDKLLPKLLSNTLLLW